MDDPDSVLAFHIAHPILQAPIYRLNAIALSRLLPEDGRLFDLGSGSGRLLIEIARARPDVRAEGRDLAENMLAAGRAAVAAAGLEDRVAFEAGDMTAVEDPAGDVDVVSCVWALHHLPDADQAARCLREIDRIRSRHNAAVWIFDFARMPTADAFRAVMDSVPGVPPRLYEDGILSEAASWTAAELAAMLADTGLGDLAGGPEQRIGHLQAWSSRRPAAAEGAHERHWRADPLSPPPASELAERIAASLPGLP